jgi:hypothetical protein
MRPTARGFAQHGGPPGWLDEKDPAGRDLVRDGQSMPSALTDRNVCPALSGATQLRASGKSSCCC